MLIPITKKEFIEKCKISRSTFQRLMKKSGVFTGHKNYLMPNDLELIATKTGIKY